MFALTHGVLVSIGLILQTFCYRMFCWLEDQLFCQLEVEPDPFYYSAHENY